MLTVSEYPDGSGGLSCNKDTKNRTVLTRYPVRHSVNRKKNNPRFQIPGFRLRESGGT